MKTSVVVSLIIVAFVFVCDIIGIASYVSWSNYGNRTEQALDASYQNNQNILAQYTTKISEMAQVPTIYRNDLEKIISDTFHGRYGDNGSQAMVQFIKEQNLNLDPSMYKNIQTQMIAGRDEFQNAQTSLIDEVRSYKTNLGNVWSGFWLHAVGYPKVNLDLYKPVINDHTVKAFATKRDEGVKLNSN